MSNKPTASDEIGEHLLALFDKYGIKYHKCRPKSLLTSTEVEEVR